MKIINARESSKNTKTLAELKGKVVSYCNHVKYLVVTNKSTLFTETNSTHTVEYIPLLDLATGYLRHDVSHSVPKEVYEVVAIEIQ